MSLGRERHICFIADGTGAEPVPTAKIVQCGFTGVVGTAGSSYVQVEDLSREYRLWSDRVQRGCSVS